MLPSVIASAIAAADLGYPTLADVIIADELGPKAIARLFAPGMAKDCAMVCDSAARR
jgi:hypothetical protein